MGDALAGDTPLLVNESYNKGRARVLHGAMHALNDDIDGQVRAGTLASDAPKLRAWKNWINGYGRWFGSVPAGLTGVLTGWGSGAVASMLDSYEREMVDWRDWYARTFRGGPSGVYNPAGTDAGNPDGAGFPKKMPAWVWAGLAVAGLYAAGNFVKGLRG